MNESLGSYYFLLNNIFIFKKGEHFFSIDPNIVILRLINQRINSHVSVKKAIRYTYSSSKNIMHNTIVFQDQKLDEGI